MFSILNWFLLVTKSWSAWKSNKIKTQICPTNSLTWVKRSKPEESDVGQEIVSKLPKSLTKSNDNVFDIWSFLNLFLVRKTWLAWENLSRPEKLGPILKVWSEVFDTKVYPIWEKNPTRWLTRKIQFRLKTSSQTEKPDQNRHLRNLVESEGLMFQNFWNLIVF